MTTVIPTLVTDAELHGVLGEIETPTEENGRLESYEEWFASKMTRDDDVCSEYGHDPFETLAAKEAIYGKPIVHVDNDDDIQEHIDVLMLLTTVIPE